MGILLALLGQEAVEGMVGAEGSLRVVEGKMGMEEMLRGRGGEEEGEELEESGVVREALPFPFPQLASSLQLQLSLPSLPPLLRLSLLLSPPLPPLPTFAPCSSRGPLPVQIQLFLGGHSASFPHVDLDPDLIQVPRTSVPSSLFWPLKQT